MVSELQRRVAEKVALWLQAFCLLRPHSLGRWAGSFAWLSFRLGFRVSQNRTTLQVVLGFVDGTWENMWLKEQRSNRHTFLAENWCIIARNLLETGSLGLVQFMGPWHHGLFLDLPPFEWLGLLPLSRLSFKGSCPSAMTAVKRRVGCLAFLLAAPRS